MARARVIGLTLLALTVPTFAFGGEEAQPGPATLTVGASLKGCGVANAQVTCQIEASWNQLEGAEHYTVSVARPDGVVLDLGQSAGTSRSIFVPYVGRGNYSVQVVAWGTPPGENEAQVLDRERSSSTDRGKVGVHAGGARTGDAGAPGEGREPDELTGEAPREPEPTRKPADPEPPACEEEQSPDERPERIVPDDAKPGVAVQTEQYDPPDADGDDRCALEPSP